MIVRTTAELGRALYATKDFAEKELVHVEKPFVVSARDDPRGMQRTITSITSTEELRSKINGLFVPEDAPTPEHAKFLTERALPTTGPESRVALAFDFNGFAWADGGVALFEIGSLFAHSCIPNVSFEACLESGVQRWTSLCPISAGSLLSVNYIGDDVFRPTEYRRAKLLFTKGFVCKCQRCLDQFDGVSGVPCPRSGCQGLAMPDLREFARSSKRTWRCGSATCGATLFEGDWPAGHWSRVEQLLKTIQALDLKATVESSAPPMSVLESLITTAVSLIGKWHWGTIVLLLMNIDIQITGLRLGLPGHSADRLTELAGWVSKWNSVDPRVNLGVVSPLGQEKLKAIRQLVPMALPCTVPAELCPACSKAATFMCSRCHSVRYCRYVLSHTVPPDTAVVSLPNPFTARNAKRFTGKFTKWPASRSHDLEQLLSGETLSLSSFHVNNGGRQGRLDGWGRSPWQPLHQRNDGGGRLMLRYSGCS